MANKLGDRSTRPHRAPHNKFSGGKYSRAISDRSGLEFPYQEMVFEWNGAFVHNSEFEPKQPQLDLTYYTDAQSLQNARPQKEFHTIVIPDYVILQYSCMIWTDYVAQMNKLIEMINYSSDSYWGDKERFKFNARIDTYNNTTEIAQGENRIVKTNFGLTIQGYLVPDSLNKDLAKKPQKFFSKSRVVFNSELIVEPTGEPLTREQVRGAPVTTDIQQIGTGVGYQILEESNQIG